MPRIFISDKLEAAGIDLLKTSGLDIDNRPGLKDAALQEALQAADGMIVRSGTRVTAAMLENPGKLRRHQARALASASTISTSPPRRARASSS